MRSLLIASSLLGAAALSDSEIAKFGSRACSIGHGTCRGETLSGSVSVLASAGQISIRTNSVPDHATCADDVEPGQTCYNAPLTAYIQPQDIALTIPRTPAVSDAKTALPAGPIAYATNGVAIFSAYSAPCSDALTDEAIGFDACQARHAHPSAGLIARLTASPTRVRQGHPEPNRGVYHYHAASSCLDGYMEALEKKARGMPYTSAIIASAHYRGLTVGAVFHRSRRRRFPDLLQVRFVEHGDYERAAR